MSQLQSNKEKYRLFCETHRDVPLFLQPWYMDAVCKKNDWWKVFLYEKNNEIRGVFVCYFTRKAGIKFIIQPMFTQYNGIWLIYDETMSAEEKLSFEKKAITNLIQQLDNTGFDYLNQNFPPNFQNWLPLFWQGYKQSTRYSYRISDISNPDVCFKNFSYAKQKQIRKAGKKLHVSFEMSGEEFYNHLSDYFKARNENVIFSKNLFLKFYDACEKRNQGTVISVVDAEGTVHAALFVVWDANSAYNLISSIHPLHKSSGGSTLVVFEAIKYFSNIVPVFDFEGSMEKNIENSFSQFGTEQLSYFNIKKYNSLISSLLFPVMKL
ncbi:MAG: methicillin resistance protein [Bacteroidales bacterium]|nr:methicillin resistance protein [Bacteroidales bacterium]